MKASLKGKGGNMKEYPCRCGGKTRLEFRDEYTKDVLIKDVPLLVCTKCGEEWYPPGVPRMIEGIREATESLDKVKVFAELTKQR
jgi:YgiT-type zinc finger domain-containing protein